MSLVDSSRTYTLQTCGSARQPSGWKNKRRNTGAIVRVRGATGTERVIVIDVGKTFLIAATDLFPQHDLRRIDAVLLTHGHADGRSSSHVSFTLKFNSSAIPKLLMGWMI
jgi:phosphoribosyl 1,2-cyclic phosphodiesterase